MCRRAVGGWAPWGHMYFCVGVRLAELTVQALTKLAVSEPLPVASFIIHSSFNRSNLEEKFLKTKARDLCVPVTVVHCAFLHQRFEKRELNSSQAQDLAFVWPY